MLKKVLSMALLLCGCLFAGAQQPAFQELPLDAKVKHGTLPNGLNYYILHNEGPKEKANFYIAQKVGSTLETPEQLGLAHFLEHMAFNGTKNYPGKKLLDYLQGKGIRFGADINAYTAFDQTVYNINNIPTTDSELMDAVLLALHDWSGSIDLLDDEINAERGVIQEEWRMRNDANTRFFTAALPKIYSEYQYQQMPIGKMEVVMNFAPDAIRDYYKKWYRPDQQGIVIVGDFDADEMENKVKKLFSDIPMPENAAERTYPKVSDNEKPIYFAMSDPEMQYVLTSVYFKEDQIPVEYRNTDQAFITEICKSLASSMINNRLQELSQDPKCPFAFAGVSFGTFLVSKTKDCFSINILSKDATDVPGSINAAMSEVARSCKTGFSESEFTRAKDQLLAGYEKRYNERNKTNNDALANQIIDHFIDNDPYPGMEVEYQLVQGLLPQLQVSMINGLMSQVLTPDNQVITMQMPEKEGFVLPAEADVLAAVSNALNGEYEAYVDEVITDPLIAKLPKKGKIKSEKENAQFGTTEMILSNGVKVVVKKTDSAADQILMQAVKKGGKDTYPLTPDNVNDMQVMEIAAEVSDLGKFDNKQMQKYLAGKNLSLNYSLDNGQTAVAGSTTLKDLPTFMEVLYSEFTQLNPNQETYDATVQSIMSMIKNQDKNPQKIFTDSLYMNWYDHNPIFLNLSASNLEKANYARCLDKVRKSLSNAADYTFVFVGNIDAAALKPYLEQYVATLPSKGKPTAQKYYPIKQTTGQVDNKFDITCETPTVMIAGVYSDTNVPYTIENAVKVSLIGDILGNIYTRTLREEEGGAYSPYGGANLSMLTGNWSIIYNVQTNEEKMDVMIRRANEELLKLLNEGASESDFNTVKEAAMNQYSINSKKNGYWLSNLVTNYVMGIDRITNHEAALKNLTLADLNAFMKNLYNGKNCVKVEMIGKK